ncbi:hypothetical protein [Celeribacter indicus]|uniref:Uncharacterized protein n=1 Tax=Celeribacter indicus TaxID=1208324 RepID=A0A0B5E610_9RHOB|nr:hypothetical protein [Celeribacter indicus]AJE48471.1 hypothetical protein P73_3756 [Celeribacter indicus]
MPDYIIAAVVNVEGGLSFGYMTHESSSSWFLASLQEQMPHVKYTDETSVLNRMQRIFSLNEQAQVRTAALADIGYQRPATSRDRA